MNENNKRKREPEGEDGREKRLKNNELKAHNQYRNLNQNIRDINELKNVT